MVLTNDPALNQRCRSLRNLAFGPPSSRYVHEELGWNFRLSNVQAAIGVAQLERVNEFVDRKRAMGRYYTRHLAELQEIELPIAQTEYAENVYWVYGILLKEGVGRTVSDVMTLLQERGVATRSFFWPMHQQPVFLKRGLFHGESYPGAESLARRGFYLPSGLAITESQMDFVVGAVKSILK